MTLHLATDWVVSAGRAVGFDKVGIAPAAGLPKLTRLKEWLARGYAGEMAYLENPKREDVRQVMPDARSGICCALGYDTNQPRSTGALSDPERGWVSRYAWGEDYHRVIEAKLERLRQTIAERAGDGFKAKLYVDTGPVPERVYAESAGIGWQAKNTCLIDPELGSFFFLGLLVTNLDIEPGAPPADQCGACTLCIDACPTGAITEPYVLDARRCISYLTIELRGPIPEELRGPMGRHIFGCDICQDVCPWNERSVVPDREEFQPRELTQGGESLHHPPLEVLAGISPEDFSEEFRGSPLKRAKWRGLMRNIIVAMGNSRWQQFRPILERFAEGEDTLLAEHARWALARISQARESPARRTLKTWKT